jgi:phytoene dehydrogenase-like protein
VADKTVIIIGAGIAGLSAGCYARMNGYQTTIFELHDLPGGLCTAWKRKDYLFDGCLHYLFGSSPGRPFYDLWSELGVIEDQSFFHHDQLMQVSDLHGKKLIVYADPDQLEEHMCSISPDDAALIEELCSGIRQFADFNLAALTSKPKELMSVDEWRQLGFQMMPYVLPLARWGMISGTEFGKQFQNPFLKQAVPLMFGWPDAPVMVGMQLLASLYTKNAGFPAGGSLDFSRRLENRYLALGGNLVYKTQVEKILVEEERAVGVRLYNDEIHYADYVISAADGHGTIFDLIGQDYAPNDVRRRYDGHLPVMPMMQISFGINRDLTGEPPWAHYLLDQPALIGGRMQAYLSVKSYSFDPSFAPPGKSSLVIMLPASYAYWQHIFGRKIYDTEQIQVEKLVLNTLEQIYPGISSQVEVSDVATPLSFERYTGNWHGSTCGFLLTRETMLMLIKGVKKTLPGLENFFMAGHWVEPGGSVPIAAASGRNAVQLVCHTDGVAFNTEGITFDPHE